MPPLFLIVRVNRLWLPLPVFLVPVIVLMLVPFVVAADLLRFCWSLFCGEGPARRLAWTSYALLTMRLYLSLKGFRVLVENSTDIINIRII